MFKFFSQKSANNSRDSQDSHESTPKIPKNKDSQDLHAKNALDSQDSQDLRNFYRVDSPKPTNHANPTNPTYTHFIVLAFVLTAIYGAIYAIMRIFMVRSNIEGANLFSAEFMQMFIMGARFDMRAICIFTALVVILGYMMSLCQAVGARERERESSAAHTIYANLATFIHKFTLILTALCAFIVAFSAFVNFYYFATYHTKIDAFIFGLKDDETGIILGIIFNDYPLVRVILASVIFSVVCYKIAKFILGVNLTRFTHFLSLTRFTKLPRFVRIAFILVANLLLLGVIFLGIRGSVGTFPLKENEANFSTNQFLNHIAINPIMAFVWALGNYQNQDRFAPINPQDLHNLERELFPIFAHNPQQSIKNPPHIVAVLMESFGNNALTLLDSPNCDLLGNFRAHFEAGKTPHKNQRDFTFNAFLSAQNGTMASFAGLFFISPSATISVSSVKKRKIALTPFDIYKKAGYEVIFITSGSGSWYNLDDYITMLGAYKVFDRNALIQIYPQSANFVEYSVPDEYAFKLALEILKNAKKPTFIAMLTISNHPPYGLPSHFTPPKCDIEPLREYFSNDKIAKNKEAVKSFAYASSAFGDFVSAIKADSRLKDSTIIAGSGDHKLRDLKASANLVLDFSVPLYMYIPPRYTQDFKARGFGFRADTIGSHKDIFPTIYALSLNNYDFLSLGGRNLFDKNADSRYNFAINGALWIDEFGIYPNSAKIGYKYELKNGEFVMSGESFEISQEKAQFMERYNALNRAQVNYRIFRE